ncbi:MAG: bifunctional serine/threonine-protein kinase/formylglycine-generating enzyme family protein [Victivallaceae bacterium]|nr:bifunctional serine/threonine-protein kinase/formylglycine-generating enzyme family protein [Victivallaceae bacterium]
MGDVADNHRACRDDGADERTLIFGGESDEHVSPDELRRGLDIPDGSRIQEYRSISTIGVGGIGAVFSAREPGLNREVALKILRPQYRGQPDRVRDFIREARTTAQIDHPNIVPVHKLGVFDDVGLYFTMKKVDGETLRMVLKNLESDKRGYRRNYSLRRLLEIYIGICNGVAFAHRHGILHCDLKPGNIMVGDYGEVMVMDWGMARYREELDQAKSPDNKMHLDLERELRNRVGKGNPNEVGGTTAFMPPEVLTGRCPTPDARCDIYSLGAILYTILTWKTSPFEAAGGDQALTVRLAASGSFKPPGKSAPRSRQVPRELEAIVMKAMARAPEKRYQTVGALLEDIRAYLDGQPVAAYSPSRLYRLGKLIRRRPLIPSVLAAALLTWGGFVGTDLVTRSIQTRSLGGLAETNYLEGRKSQAAAQRLYRELESMQAEGVDAIGTQRIQRDFLNELDSMNSSYGSALEFIARLGENGRPNPKYEKMAADIFSWILDFYTDTRDYPGLKDTLRNVNIRWRSVFEAARNADPVLAGKVDRLKSGMGFLRLSDVPDRSWKMKIADASGHPVNPGRENADGEAVTLTPGDDTFALPMGIYNISIASENNNGFTFPALVPLSEVETISLKLPESRPPDTVFVPGGWFLHDYTVGRHGANRGSRPGFLIGAHEVTIGEYLGFWKQLPPEMRKHFTAISTVGTDGEQAMPVWNEAGELRTPFREDLPVTGITLEAANSYANWLGQKYGLIGRLPDAVEWEKAARGIDGRLYPWGNIYREGAALLADDPAVKLYPAGSVPGNRPQDRSIYGCYDMSGNVREFLRPQADGGLLYAVAGGSFLSGRNSARCNEINYIGGAADDVGFRCMFELGKKAEADLEKSL